MCLSQGAQPKHGAYVLSTICSCYIRSILARGVIGAVPGAAKAAIEPAVMIVVAMFNAYIPPLTAVRFAVVHYMSLHHNVVMS